MKPKATLLAMLFAALAVSNAQADTPPPPPLHGGILPLQGTWASTLLPRDLGTDGVPDAFYDTQLHITWLADANFARTSGADTDGAMVWTAALQWAQSLHLGGVSGWRLPGSSGIDVSWGGTWHGDNELLHLHYVTLGNCHFYDCWDHWGLSNTGPFKNLPGAWYWSGTERSGGQADAFNLRDDYDLGFVYPHAQTELFSAWVVHDGDIGSPVPEPGALALMVCGLLGVGLASRLRVRGRSRAA